MVLMNATTIDLPAAVMGFAGVHLALRAEATGIAHLVAEGDDHQARRRAALLGRVLAAHHRTEDHLLWPAIEARQPGFTMTTVELEDQHRQLDEQLEGLVDDPASIDGVGAFLEQHLQDEEQRALPVWLASFDAADHERFGRLLRRSTPRQRASGARRHAATAPGARAHLRPRSVYPVLVAPLRGARLAHGNAAAAPVRP
jgi:hypothetical protein